jgi:hypothetical protein
MAALRTLAENILAGARLALFLRLAPGGFRIGLNHFVRLLVLGLVLELGVIYLTTGAPRSFNFEGIPAFGFAVLVALAATYLLALTMGSVERTLDVLIPLTAAGIWFTPIALVIIWFATPDILSGSISPHAILVMQIVIAAIVLWGLAIGFRAIRLAWSASIPRVLLGLFVLNVVNFSPILLGTPESIWVTLPEVAAAVPQGEVAVAQSRLADRVPVEETYRAQSRLMADEANAMAAQRPGVTDLYFLGFGSYADQDVFMREVHSVRVLFDQRFNTSGRSIVLINNKATVAETPIASLSNLEDSLKLIGERIDPEEDIVFMYLTSHGSAKHRLSVDFWPLGLRNIAPEDLKAAMDAAKIKWRVIVISACYSGGFIDPLKDDNTLIMTASRADRKSFGCSNEADYTYFGEALFNQELRHQTSFMSAFQSAREAIKQRELAEGKTPSEPQVHMGLEIERKLVELEDRLRLRQSAEVPESRN